MNKLWDTFDILLPPFVYEFCWDDWGDASGFGSLMRINILLAKGSENDECEVLNLFRSLLPLFIFQTIQKI